MSYVINTFNKGAISDIDSMLVPNDVWTFPTVNVMVSSKDGKGLIITNYPGNTRMNGDTILGDNGEEFSMSDGFMPIGCCEFNGIVYICSVNSNGVGEIGCFPSPLQNGGGFERIYKPLYNYDDVNNPGTTRGIFRTSLFHFSLYKQIDMFGVFEYDDTVNIFMCDHLNNNRIINNGFNKEGNHTNRIYCQKDFNSVINQVLTYNNEMISELIDIDPLGKLKYGNYYIYVRYSTVDFNRTTYVGEFGPYQVSKGGSDIIDTIASTEGGLFDDESNKKIHIKLKDLDTTYYYVEIAYVRFFSNDSGIILTEAKKIESPYKINGTELDIIIYGNESIYDTTIEEIQKRSISTQVCKTHTLYEGVYYGSNWKTKPINNDELANFIGSMRLTYTDSGPLYKEVNGVPITKILSPHINEARRNTSPLNQSYMDYRLTYHNVGHFRGEAYAYSVIAKLKDGRVTEAFTPKGIDALNMTVGMVSTAYNNNDPLVNNDGVIRFPSNYISKMLRYNALEEDGDLHPLGVVLDMTKAFGSGWEINYPWIRDNVEGFYLLRSERNKNLLYQGYAIAACSPFIYNESLIAYTNMYTDPMPEYPQDTFGGIHLYPWTPGSDNEEYIGTDYGLPIAYGQPASWDNGDDAGENWWNLSSEGKTKEAIHYYKNVLYPFYKGYAPMHYVHEKRENSDNGLVKNINYQTRWYLIPNMLSIYSFDFMFNEINDIDNINHLHRTAYTYGKSYDGVTGFAHHMYRNYEVENGLSILPRIYFDDISTYACYNYSGNTHKLNSVIAKIGEESNINYSNFADASAKFINETTDVYTDEFKCSYHAARIDGNDKIWTVRSSLSPKYIGIKLDDFDFNKPGQYYSYQTHGHKDCNLTIVSLYKHDPTELDIKLMYNPRTLMYYKVSEFLKLSEISVSKKITAWKGDCFLGRNYFKQRYWTGSSFGSKSEHTGYDPVGTNEMMIDAESGDHPNGEKRHKARFTHGLVLGFVSENENNISMRANGKSTRFYPNQSSMENYSISPYNTSGIESLLLNKGYNQVLGIQFYRLRDEFIPIDVEEYPVRTRHSHKQIEKAYENGLRIIDISSYKDYNSNKGQIMRTVVHGNKLVSIQESLIFQHAAGEQNIKAPTSAGELIVGIGSMLADNIEVLAEYGTQNMWSVGKGALGLYGYDWKKNIFWKVQESATGLGTNILTSSNIGIVTNNEKWLYDNKEYFKSYFNDITDTFEDTPSAGNGISFGYDLENKLVYITFRKTAIMEKEEYRIFAKTLVYNEKYQIITGENTFNSPFYMQINTNLFMAHWNYFGAASNKIYMANQPSTDYSRQMFYGAQDEFVLSTYIKGDEGSQLMSKLFPSQDIHSNEEEFTSIKWETEYQIGESYPFISPTEFWRNATYQEHKWHVPVNVKTDINNYVEYDSGSEMRGTWLKTTIEYTKTKLIFVKNIITYYLISKY